MEGNLRFKIDWASLIVGNKFTVLALFYFVFEGNFPLGAYIWRGLHMEGLIFGILRYLFLFSFLWKGHFFTNSHNITLIHVRYVVLCLAKGEKEPFDFNSFSYGYLSMALSFFF